MAKTPFTDYRVKAVTRSSRDLIEETTTGSIIAYVEAPAENNLANLSIVALIARHYNVPHKNVMIIRGTTSPNKVVRVYQS